MSHATGVVSIHPYFKAKPGKLAEAKAMLPKFVERAANEKLILHYDFTINGEEIHCRESYIGAEGVIAHLDNVEGVLTELLKIVDLTRLELHGPAAELDKLKSRLEGFKPSWFAYECGLSQ